ncbi:3-phosphoglycerate dehydrogenase [Skermanella stibiiresistens SB22]|uniref:D-3-phosphoglycerate dehydrogenase n=1 Tax=Skermanella stibiiresistens SB22 TaxID=1385369 RepID=W9HBG6_9PROT|nr:phosphoglycerate dehydrogenase [Skermanella stibiiresistens]EWY42081.1 3-phosphoglycerate dehydrogenase [Skermanella stibiiresistens SB22]
MSRLSFPKEKISILLLEGIHENAVAELAEHGYTNVTKLPKALDEADLVERLSGVHMVGIRSRSQLTRSVLERADKLMAVGCFCIGTNQVDLGFARQLGVPVFNAPHSNTRSVAELVMGEIIMLMRGIWDKSRIVHQGGWVKSAKDSYEIRGKVLGIVGYGHIGTQLSVIAEALGMRVRFYDVQKKLALGNAQPCRTLDELLTLSDVVSLHVPDTAQTRDMIGPEQIRAMRKGSYLINAARGSIIDIDALAAALKSGHLLGAAVDVFPVEPASDNEEFISPLRDLPNVILTPHIGGSTKEAQANIGNEVARKLIEYSDNGSTMGAVNFPEVQLPVRESGVRFLHIHANVPGVLRKLNEVFASRGLNITGQYLQTDPSIGYVVFDVDGEVDDQEILADMRAIEGTLRSRVLYDRRV